MRRPCFSSKDLYAVAVVLLVLSFAAVAQPSDAEVLPNGRKSDGCTLIPDGHIKPCCLTHDQAYYRGGTRNERVESDKNFYDCVRAKKGFHHKILAPFVWLGVRLGGIPFLPTKFRWGFGTKDKRYAKRPAKRTIKDPP